MLIWQRNGAFPLLYRAACWDDLYKCCPTHGQWGKLGISGNPHFHVLECIRCLGCEWGTLPKTNLAPPPLGELVPQDLERCLLLYVAGPALFRTHQTSRTAPVFQVPRVVVQFTLLSYFSILARYHVTNGQELLGGATEPEGYVFRAAFEDAAHQ